MHTSKLTAALFFFAIAAAFLAQALSPPWRRREEQRPWMRPVAYGLGLVAVVLGALAFAVWQEDTDWSTLPGPGAGLRLVPAIIPPASLPPTTAR